jgi:hypothetical protein
MTESATAARRPSHGRRRAAPGGHLGSPPLGNESIGPSPRFPFLVRSTLGEDRTVGGRKALKALGRIGD